MALWYLESYHKQFSVFFFFFLKSVLMKGHKISGRCEREKKSKGVKKTGKLRRDEKIEEKGALVFGALTYP